MATRRSQRRGASRTTDGRTTVRNNKGPGTGYSTSTQMQEAAARAESMRRIGNMYAPGGTRDATAFSGVRVSLS